MIKKSRSNKRANLNSKRGIESKYVVKMFKGLNTSIGHNLFTESTYQTSKTIMHTLTFKKIKTFSTENLKSVRKVSEN